MARVATKSKPPPQLPATLVAELERRRAGMARHMARAVVTLVRWDDSTGVPPQRSAIAKACEAGPRLFHALISDNFDSELELQKQALALNMPIAPTGYVAAVCKLVIGNRDGEQGGEGLAEVAASLQLPRGAIFHATDPTTLVILWPS